MAASVRIEFDDGSRVISQTLEDAAGLGEEHGSGGTRPSSSSILDYYEIQRTTDFISKGNFRRVALQFPDPLLGDAPEVLWTLESRLRKQRGKPTGQHTGGDGVPGEPPEGGVDEPMIFVTGDTSYGSCCVDEIAAKHLKADAIVHYGRACLSPTSSSVPVLYVFGKGTLDVKHLAQCLLDGPLQSRSPRTEEGASKPTDGTEATAPSPVLLLFDVTYAHAIPSLVQTLGNDSVREGKLVVGFPAPEAYRPSVDAAPRGQERCCRDGGGEGYGSDRRATSERTQREALDESGTRKSSIDPGASSYCREKGGTGCRSPHQALERGFEEGEMGRRCESKTAGSSAMTGTTAVTRGDAAALETRISTEAKLDAVTSLMPSVLTLEPHSPAAPTARRKRVVRIGGLGVELDSEEALKDCTVVFVGPEGRQLTNVLLRCASSRHRIRYDPSLPAEDRLVADTRRGNKDLMRRYYLVQRAREASVIGIVVGTLGVQRYAHVVRALREMIEEQGRKAYTLAVGKINVAKLANFAEVEVFCLVACAENSLLDSKEFHAPVVTPLELTVAFGIRDWDGFYSTDFDDIPGLTGSAAPGDTGNGSHPGGSPSIDGTAPASAGSDDEGDRPIFSLVSGTFKNAPGFPSATRRTVTAPAASGAGVRDGVGGGNADDDRGALTNIGDRSIVEWSSPAADFLSQRSYKGLEPLVGQTEAKAATEGQAGIASDYGGW